MNVESWTVRARQGAYSAEAAAIGNYDMDWAVEGLLPATGTSVWFGTGSTGKTQLLLWLAAHIVARSPKRPKRWLGADVRVCGQILVLSAEDLREHLFQRVGAIARWMEVDPDGSRVDAEDVCRRIHVMPFLSMTNAEFDELNPALFERGAEGRWQPTSTLNHIERFIDEWNSNAISEGRPEDRFVGVILDSAVSMAGFEMSQSEATSNFLFHLNRMSRRQNMFWAIIGHTPKDAGKKIDDPAIERLRGSAMWSTTPRTVIEVRTAGSGDNTADVLASFPELSERDIVFVSTAKANSMDADLKPRALRRVFDGPFVDISESFPTVFEKLSAKTPDFVDRGSVSEPLDQSAAWLAIVDLVEIIDKKKNEDGFTRSDLEEEFQKRVSVMPALKGVSPNADGKYSKRNFSLAWYIFKLKDIGAIEQRQNKFRASNLDRARQIRERNAREFTKTELNEVLSNFEDEGQDLISAEAVSEDVPSLTEV